jgi:glycerol kinase
MSNTPAPGYVLALDLGTTGNRAILFDTEGKIVSSAYRTHLIS